MEIKRKELVVREENIGFGFCHGSTLEKIGENRYVCAFFAGSTEGAVDTGIYFCRRNEDGWQKPERISPLQNVAHWNPILFYQSRQETLFIFYKVGNVIQDWETMYRYSKDGGISWSEERTLVPGDRSGGRGPVRNKIIHLSNGTYIAGASSEKGANRAFVDIGNEDFSLWQRSNFIELEGIHNWDEKVESDIAVSEQSFYGRGVIQPTLWESEAGCVHMLLRSTEGCIFRSDSSDYGCTWGKPYPTSMPNNNSGIDVAQMGNSLYLAYNPVGRNWGERTPLTLARSYDNGITWENLLDFETAKGEFSYPAIIARNDSLFVSYTYDRKNIAFCVL